MNVLVVDDDKAMALLIAATLRALAARIEVATTYGEAREWIKKVVFNIILLDIGLPDSLPEDTLSHVAEMKQGGAKVAIITGAWPPRAIVSPETSGADAVIYKGDTYMLDKLKEMVTTPSEARPQPAG